MVRSMHQQSSKDLKELKEFPKTHTKNFSLASWPGMKTAPLLPPARRRSEADLTRAVFVQAKSCGREVDFLKTCCLAVYQLMSLPHAVQIRTGSPAVFAFIVVLYLFVFSPCNL